MRRRLFVAVLLALMFGIPGPATAQPLNAWLDPDLGNMKCRISYSLNYSPDRQVEDQEEELGYTRNQLSAVTPLWQNPNQELAMHASVANVHVNTNAVLPDSGRAFPSDLWDLRIGSSYRHKLKRGWVLGGELTVGSPSDKPFYSYDETSINAKATLLTVQGEKHFWLFGIHYSNTRDFLTDIPIPGVIYGYRPDPSFQLSLGFPLSSVRYKPFPKLTLQGRYIFLRTIMAKVGYRFFSWMEAYAGFDWTHQRYFLRDRTDKKDRLFFYQKVAKLGLNFFPAKNMTLDLSGGYAFDRLWFEGDDWDDRGQERIDVEDGALFSLNLRYAF